jgi:hypothetical protein
VDFGLECSRDDCDKERYQGKVSAADHVATVKNKIGECSFLLKCSNIWD